jgi:hypothetical protein
MAPVDHSEYPPKLRYVAPVGLARAAKDWRVHHVSNYQAVTRPCSVSFVPALSFKLVARRHVDYGRTRSMICMPA